MKNNEFQQLFELSPVPMWVFEIATLLFLDVNNSAIANYGYSKEEFLTMSINQIRPIEDAGRVEGVVKKNAISGKFYSDVFRHLHKNGDIMHVQIASSMINFDGKQARLVFANDISDELASEEKLAIELSVKNTSDGILITDANEENPVIIYVNDAMVKISGFNREELIGQFSEILDRNTPDLNARYALQKAIRNKVPCKTELVNYTKTGERYHVSVNLTPVFENGVLNKWVSIRRDVTENRKYINEIEAQNKKLDNLNWLQSHSVRTPLAKLMQLVELLEVSNDQKITSSLIKQLRLTANDLDSLIISIAEQTEHY